jgi:hypothetical protein
MGVAARMRIVVMMMRTYKDENCCDDDENLSYSVLTNQSISL